MARENWINLYRSSAAVPRDSALDSHVFMLEYFVLSLVFVRSICVFITLPLHARP